MSSARDDLSALANQAGAVAGWLARTGWQATSRMPGGPALQRRVQRLEQTLRIGAERTVEAFGSSEQDGPTLVGPASEQRTEFRAAMAELLNRSIEHNKERSRRHLFQRILDQLLPDEARILAALSDGTPFPVIHVVPRGGAEPVLRNASTVGKAAGVAAHELVPHYLRRLDGFGLLRFTAPQESLDVQFDILLTEDMVQHAVEAARAGRRLAPHVERRTVTLSELGTQFWQACDPTGAQAAVPVTEPKAGYAQGA